MLAAGRSEGWWMAGYGGGEAGLLAELIAALESTPALRTADTRKVFLRLAELELNEPTGVQDHPAARYFHVELAVACLRNPRMMAATSAALATLDEEGTAEVRRIAAELLAQPVLPPEQESVLRQLLKGLVTPRLPQLCQDAAGELHDPPDPPPDDAWSAYEALSGLNAREDRLPPSLALVEYLAAEVAYDQAIALRAWNDRQAAALGLVSEMGVLRQRVVYAPPKSAHDAYLVIRLLPRPVAAAWNMSLRRLGETNPGAFQLLQICSFFAPEPIPRRYFSGVRGVQLPRELTEVLRDPIKLGHAIRAISRYALIRVNYRDSTIQMHRLVRAVLVGQMSATERYDMRHGAHVLLANSDPGGSGAAGDWAAYAELLVHARFSRAVECDDHWVRQLVSNLVINLGGRGDYATCLDYGREVLEWWNEHLGASDLQTLTVARTVARVMRLVGEHEEAAAMNLRSLELVREHHGPDHPATLFTMSAVAQDARIKGDFEAMLELERDRWQRAVREFDEGGPDTLASANDYALALRRTGNFAAALAIDTEAKEQADLNLGQDSMLTLLLTSNLSIDIRETGEYLRARDMQEQTMQRVLQVVGDAEAPLSLVAARNLATARRKAGDHQGSVEALESTVHAYRQRLNRHNTNLSSAVLAMSMALRQNADLVEARKVGEEAFTTLRDLLGAGHPYTLAASTDLAVTLRLLGDVETARRMNEEAATRLTDRLGAGHPTALAAAANLASDRYTLADYAEAEELDSRVLELCRERLGAGHPTTLALSLNHSLDLRALGRAQEAADLHTATVERFRATLGAAHPATVGAARGMRADCDADIE